jgi:hypothetical protein
MIKKFTLTVKNNFVKAVGRRGRDTAIVVITVGVGAINLAFEKHATQSSNYNKTNYHASQAVCQATEF